MGLISAFSKTAPKSPSTVPPFSPGPELPSLLAAPSGAELVGFFFFWRGVMAGEGVPSGLGIKVQHLCCVTLEHGDMEVPFRSHASAGNP